MADDMSTGELARDIDRHETELRELRHEVRGEYVRKDVYQAALAVYAAAAMLYRAYVAKDAAVLDWDLVLAAVTAVSALWTRMQVTPLSRPRTAAGHPMHGPVAADPAQRPHE